MTTPTNSVFGAFVRARRLDRGLGLREVARILHVSPGWLSRLEHGHETGISIAHLASLAGVLEVDRDWLMLAADRVPPDVVRALKRRPDLCDLVRRRSPEPR